MAILEWPGVIFPFGKFSDESESFSYFRKADYEFCMLLIPLLLANDSPPQDPIGTAARAYSWNIINRLRSNRHEVQPLLNSMTQVCGSISAGAVRNWTQKLNVMPEHFYFTNNNVVYREFVAGGALMVTECFLTQPTVGHMGRVANSRIILNILFFATANNAAGTYEVRCIPPNGPNEVLATQKCGHDFLQMIQQMNDQPPCTAVEAPVEKKKPWWKRG